MLERAGTQILTCHGRTRGQDSGLASYASICVVKAAIPIPVFPPRHHSQHHQPPQDENLPPALPLPLMQTNPLLALEYLALVCAKHIYTHLPERSQRPPLQDCLPRARAAHYWDLGERLERVYLRRDALRARASGKDPQWRMAKRSENRGKLNRYVVLSNN
ncbi:hypothetical protein D9615_007705 [Tricholomella constricta]|uniref:DUS-like FMN-binding domain-containing protein n=1 Tax=Tricholomella constricta TaxID=117010 RepID=A0A8H5H3N4_9AGAR|nr:hypothetical protein D9615_007705 [Tricholomella constricta]